LGFLLADSGAQVLLTDRRLADLLPEHGANVVYADDEPAVVPERSELPTRVDPQCLAYVIYTSGSTGEPKGVAVTHANVSRLLAATETAFGFGNADVWTLFHSYAFDFSVWEMWGALAYGGKLVVVPYWVSRNPEEFLKLLDAERVTVLNQTPSAFWQLMQAERETRQALKSLRLVIFGGEALDVTKLSAWFEKHGDQRPTLVNMYGITETTVHVTLQVLSRETEAGPGSPIGEPLDDLRVYVLDQQQQLLPLGIWGELYVGGDGVARGYLNRPSLTAERFVPNPFSTEPGARLYRTGDLGRRLARGGLEYLGRVDQQVKVRGFRIELGEIEAALRECAGVREAAVLLRDKEERAQLVAYVVSEGEEAGETASLRAALQQRLPEYMVPAAFVQVEQMPLTANGKLDRSALLALQPETATACGDQVSPRSHVEKIVAETWQQVLGVERVGIYDNFFALGGDSILSLQIVSRLNQAGFTMTPQDLFQHPTVAELSAALEHTRTAVHAESGPVGGPVPLTPIQHWFFEQQFADAHHWNQAVMFEVREALDTAALKRAIGRLLEHHDALRLRFVRDGDGWQQFNAEHEGDTPLTIVELNGLSEADQRRTIELAASKWQASLNLSEGPLVRAVYFEANSANARRLLLIIHHLVVDAVSWRILFEDLERAYGQAAIGMKIAFARKTTSFKQWAERLQAYAEAGDARREAEYWLSERWLKADPLPVDLDPWSTGEAAATPNSEASANTVQIDFEIDETDALLHKTTQVFRTRVVEALVAALGRALWRWYGARFVLLDVESHGREAMFDGIDVSRTVGWFTTIYPVLLETGGPDGDEVEVLKTVKEQLRQVPHHGIGYGALRHLNRESATALRARPRAQVLFNYLGQLDRGLPEGAIFRISTDSAGPVRSARAQRTHLLEINSYVAGGRLRVEWKYSEDIHRRGTIERLSESFRDSLRALLAHTHSPRVFELTPSDFPMVQLSSEQLEGALAEVTFDD
jgi:fengycin family lipopeptide synthetase B